MSDDGGGLPTIGRWVDDIVQCLRTTDNTYKRCEKRGETPKREGRGGVKWRRTDVLRWSVAVRDATSLLPTLYVWDKSQDGRTRPGECAGLPGIAVEHNDLTKHTSSSPTHLVHYINGTTSNWDAGLRPVIGHDRTRSGTWGNGRGMPGNGVRGSEERWRRSDRWCDVW